ncbi:UDP-N-acetylmuramyl pentapeptide phosphotransferase/UDP-N-acetylglucosamine-1-phosphate transferase [Elusimicrobium minutum Pei191]|uniref:UDP-N-acetylmuramyl pentapeptide phosphotransferase/UDP-N-acetylglucosamine-1-phosphate transferase n=1 Tax=Elusimicrobium minutum (strain Pei191) TaxID=445932 RepID=B2KD51_ELUMP|nr:MraY family glycosyltransferase [Elusimicrobium minutum]ACC98447.1 UDP-N-acetylmuramyl pentapeptide phosphotransferase/UDP-N-acetylglucosamine-1-phosphate transferase [Elusimicrobium minutum Pei191]
MQNLSTYVFCTLCALLISSILAPALVFITNGRFTDKPGGIKNHIGNIPLVGGTAIVAGFFISLLIIRFTTDFPSGTLHSLRGIFLGGFIIYFTGIVDDLKKPKGINPGLKLLGQAAAAYILIHYGIKINFIENVWIANTLTLIWIIGLTNAFNLLDIMDGLSVSQAACASLFFIIIALPSEHIYVNFTAAALLGAALGFWPYNHSKRQKIFMGDGGSMFLGFVLAAVSLGTEYSAKNPMAVLAPILILAVPLWDTGFVFLVRTIQGKNPFLGSPDHAVILLRNKGLTPNTILALFLTASIGYGALALIVINVSDFWTYIIFAFSMVDMTAAAHMIYKFKGLK